VGGFPGRVRSPQKVSQFMEALFEITVELGRDGDELAIVAMFLVLPQRKSEIPAWGCNELEDN